MGAMDFPAFACGKVFHAALEDFGCEGAVGFAVVDGIVEHHAQRLARLVADHELISDFSADADGTSVQFDRFDLQRIGRAITLQFERGRMAVLEQRAAGVARKFFQMRVVWCRFAPAGEGVDDELGISFAEVVEMVGDREPNIVARIAMEFFQQVKCLVR